MTDSFDWDAVRLAYETEPGPMTDILRRFGIWRSTVTERAARERWVRCPGAARTAGEARRLAGMRGGGRRRPMAFDPAAGRGEDAAAAAAWPPFSRDTAAIRPGPAGPAPYAGAPGDGPAEGPDAHRPPAPGRDGVADALWRAAGTIAALLEARLSAVAAGEGEAVLGDADLKTLGALSTALVRLTAVERRERSSLDPDPPPSPAHEVVDLDDPERLDALVARLERLAAADPEAGA